MPSTQDIAAERFAAKFNCAQAVFSAFAPALGINDADALRIATAFGAGMGRQQEVCGAVTGAYMAIGAKYGMTTPAHTDAKENTYALVNEFSAKFRELHGSTICLDLLGCDMSTEEGRNEIAARDLHTTVCASCVRDACGILDTMLSSHSQQP
jgi:C_GCAxxG_C_C family probable redox protein